MVSVTHFLDHFREEVYWLTVTGRLQGILPCLGVGPRSFFSVTLDYKQISTGTVQGGGVMGEDVTPVIGEENECGEGGLFVYLNDGQGAIACVRLSD